MEGGRAGGVLLGVSCSAPRTQRCHGRSVDTVGAVGSAALQIDSW